MPQWGPEAQLPRMFRLPSLVLLSKNYCHQEKSLSEYSYTA